MQVDNHRNGNVVPLYPPSVILHAALLSTWVSTETEIVSPHRVGLHVAEYLAVRDQKILPNL